MKIHDYSLARIKYVSILHIDWEYLKLLHPVFCAYEYSAKFIEELKHIGVCDVIQTPKFEYKYYRFKFEEIWPQYSFDLETFLDILENPSVSMQPQHVLCLDANHKVIKRFCNL